MPKEPIKIGNAEIRLDDNGELDEIVISDSDGRCTFHIERMSDESIWARFYHTEKQNMAEKDIVMTWHSDTKLYMSHELETAIQKQV